MTLSREQQQLYNQSIEVRFRRHNTGLVPETDVSGLIVRGVIGTVIRNLMAVDSDGYMDGRPYKAYSRKATRLDRPLPGIVGWYGGMDVPANRGRLYQIGAYENFAFWEIERRRPDKIARACGQVVNKAHADAVWQDRPARDALPDATHAGLVDMVANHPVLRSDTPPPLTNVAFVSEVQAVSNSIFEFLNCHADLPFLSATPLRET